MAFTAPIYLLLLIPALAYLLWVARGMHGMARARKRLAIAVRAVVVLLMILALSGAQGVRRNRGVTTIYVLDGSASMPDAASKAAEAFMRKSLQARGTDDNAGLICFGKDPVIDVNPGPLSTLGRIDAAPDRTATDLAAAIRLASATFPEGSGRRIVLLTDGNETNGDAAQAAQAASLDGIQVDYVPLPVPDNSGGEVVLSDVASPPEATLNEPFEVRVVAEASQPGPATIRLDRDGTPVARVQVNLTRGANAFPVAQSVPVPGFHKYRAVIEAARDSDARNNVGMSFVNVRGRPRVLLLEGLPGSGAALQQALKVQGLSVTALGPSGVPTAPEEIQQYDSVVFDDIPAEAMTDFQMRLLQTSVRDSGIGFAMIGGENSFLPGGYYETPIADLLAVDLNVRQRKSFPSTTLAIVADASGSMSMIEDGVEKIKIAASAASATVRMMSPQDFVGVAGSTDAIEFVAPIQRAEDKDRIAAQVGRLSAGGGGIYIRPSLEFAETALSKQKTRVRHLLLMADGNDCDEQEGAIEVARRMVAHGMTISVVSIGEGKDVPFLKTLAATGKGAFYLARNAKQLQRLFTRDASVVARSAIEEGTFLPKVDPGDEVLAGLDLHSMPALHAYCLASERPLSRVPMRSAKDDPLLAVWQYGLGTSLAFTSDAQPKWAKPWMGWGGFNQFWAQAIRSTLRHTSSNRLAVSTKREGGRGALNVEAYDGTGNPINGLHASVHVLCPDGSSRQVDLSQGGPGRYEGSFDATQTGAYVVTVAEPGAGGKAAVTRSGFSIAYPPEYQSSQPNTLLLARLAKLAGGSALRTPVDAFRPMPSPGKSVRDLWPALVLCAAILFPMDVAVRRIALPFAEMWAALVGVLSAILRRRRAIRRAPAPQAQTISRLHEVKRSASPPSPSTPSPNEKVVTPVESAPKPPGKSVVGSAPEPVSAAQRLLDAKRKRQNTDDSDNR